MPCVACREVVAGAVCMLRHTRLMTTYGVPPATAPGPLPPLRVARPNRGTWPNPNWHSVDRGARFQTNLKPAVKFCATLSHNLTEWLLSQVLRSILELASSRCYSDSNDDMRAFIKCHSSLLRPPKQPDVPQVCGRESESLIANSNCGKFDGVRLQERP